MQLVITPVGDVRCLYDESLDLTALGSVHIQRWCRTQLLSRRV